MTYAVDYVVAGASLGACLVVFVVWLNTRTRARRRDALTRASRRVQRRLNTVPPDVARAALGGPFVAHLAALKDGDLDLAEDHLRACEAFLHAHTPPPPSE